MLVLLILLGFGSFDVTCCFGLAVIEGCVAATVCEVVFCSGIG